MMEFKPTTNDPTVAKMELAFALSRDWIMSERDIEKRVEHFNSAYFKLCADAK